MHVTLTITGTQTDEDRESATITDKVTGEYFERGNTTYLLYDEKDPDDGTITKNMLKLSGNILSLSKKGTVVSNMTWEKGKTILSDHASPFGKLYFLVETKELQVKDNEQYLQLAIDYRLTLEDGTPISDNQLHIVVEKEP